MKESLDKSLKEAYANCSNFQILRIDLPDSYEEAIVDTQIVNQEVNT